MADIVLNADVTLNGETVDVTVYEDTDGDGTAENQASQSISDGSNSYTLSGFSGNKGSDWWLDIVPDTSASTSTPFVHSVSIEVP